MNKNQILKQYFGYDGFREGQAQLIDHILGGQDCLGIMPTGAGKSLCFQVPALLMEGITLIISPLISLMKDQVNALTQAGVAAAYINSSLSERQINIVLDRAKNNVYKLIYIAPERLLASSFLDLAKCMPVSMLAVDEAHCISQWGQDFRPSYAKIPEFIAQLPTRPIITAFTATATPKVKADIISLLKLQEPQVMVTGFNRENLFFQIEKPKNKFAALTAFLQDRKGKSGIIYCSTRNNVEEVCQSLNNDGYNASRYHAGLSDQERHQNQDNFLYDRIQIMVATNAFGMGIDKSNVSFVVHYNMPKDVESYYQEAGRGGRDGQPADCLLLYSGQDVRTNLWLIENGKDAQYSDAQTEEELKERERKRLREMTFYCTTSDCLRAYILKYFGENPPHFCGNCSNCNGNFETVDATIDAQKILSCVYRMKERFGINMIIDVLRGSKNEKVLRMGLDSLSTYGISNLDEGQLRNIINHLLLNGYLTKSDEQYSIIRLGPRAKDILQGGETLQMKLSKPKEKTEKKVKKQSAINPMEQELFAILQSVRREIAAEQRVPAFVIFSDSTLTDMCMKQPQNDEELLAVSGVGRVKLERYGPQFLSAIHQYVDENKGKAVAVVSQTAALSMDKTSILISDDDVTISAIADGINSILLQFGYKKISGAKINDWLISKGYLERITENEKNFKLPTEQGKKLGIRSEALKIKGTETKKNFYAKAAQTLIVAHLEDILQF